ncbi:MAG: (d)CMP kinase [Acidimicrobiia bacterium]
MIVAIDGPSGAGKSTLARMLAEMLNLAVLDTGAMYRAATWLVIHHGIDPSDEQGVTSLISSADFKIDERVMVNDVDVTDEIRTPLVTSKVSEVSAIPSVRAELVRRQRQWTEARGGGIVEGRDIGTVVFPDATLKIYLTADNAVRAARREEQDSGQQSAGSVAATAAALAARDHADSSRSTSPLRAAPDAMHIDSGSGTPEQLADSVVEELRRRLKDR